MTKGSLDATRYPHVAFLINTMRDKGLSVTEFADRLFVHPNTVRNWLNGQRPPLDMVNRIATILDVSNSRLLEKFGYAANMGSILDYNDQLQNENIRLADIQLKVQTRAGAGRVGVIADALARTGKYNFSVHPWWRGTGPHRVHFADFIALQPTTTTGEVLNRAAVEEDIKPEYAYVAAWFDGPEHWGHVLKGALVPPACDLVINIPRFVSSRRSQGHPDTSLPRSIAVVGGHWCGAAETASAMAYDLDYDYAHPFLVASTVHSTLPQEWDKESWFRNRLDIARTFALSTPVSRRRVWAIEYWNDADCYKMITGVPEPPFIVFLDPTDEVVEYSIRRRQQDKHTSKTASVDEKEVISARAAARLLTSRLMNDASITLRVELVKDAWNSECKESAQPAVDSWFDSYSHNGRLAVEAIRQIRLKDGGGPHSCDGDLRS
jgi:transcriptional regulator with XRE-family HTH domain